VTPSGWCSVKIAPVEIGEMLNELVYDKYQRILMTSATMTVERNFDYLEERLGIDRIPSDAKRCAVFGSSYDFKSQVRFLCSAYLPSPRSDYYQKKLSAFLKSIFHRVETNTLVLFTSYQSLLQTERDLAGQFPKLLVQEGADSADKALHDFVQLRPAILFGTESFWQGVDLPGKLLEVLVITRLPFSVPGDPVDSARMELVERRGANSFVSYSLPSAVLRFKQGFGRLIRSSMDQGIIIVTDNRLVKSSFGQVFLNSVPSEVEIASSWEEIERALDFVGGIR
jgi:ATP-dependent DNA helicase DinG